MQLAKTNLVQMVHEAQEFSQRDQEFREHAVALNELQKYGCIIKYFIQVTLYSVCPDLQQMNWSRLPKLQQQGKSTHAAEWSFRLGWSVRPLGDHCWAWWTYCRSMPDIRWSWLRHCCIWWIGKSGGITCSSSYERLSQECIPFRPVDLVTNKIFMVQAPPQLVEFKLHLEL